MKNFRFYLTFLYFACTATLSAQTAADVVVPISVSTSNNPAAITLSWSTAPSLASVTVSRKLLSQTAWTTLAQLPATATSYKDSSITTGTAYEYRVLQQASAGNQPAQRIGLVYAGLRAGAVTQPRGIIIVVLDDQLAMPLASELAVFLDDLRGDGWQPVLKTVASNTATVASVKTLLKTTYEANPAQTLAAFLIGNIPVPYSGNINPDGHSEHRGAWPTDYYYGDMDEIEWTDVSINNPTAARIQNRNVPGDGKFDQSLTPTLPEMVVSRIDFSNLSGWSVSQTELYRRYLNKNHRFRTGQYVPATKALVDDNFGYFNGEAFAQNGWRNGYALTGTSNTVAADFFDGTEAQSYLFGYGTGPGTYTGAGGVGGSENFKTDSVNIVFAQLFGSYHGDWDYETNPFMPSALASKGGILTCSWAGRPNWFLHHMGLGEPMMTSTYWVWLNSFLDTPVYSPNFGADQIHVGLLGDPTLRAHAVPPVGNLSAASTCEGRIQLGWTASSGATEGYLVYKAADKDGAFTLLTPNPISTLTYTDVTPLLGNNVYQVKAVKLQVVPTGSYLNQSVGIMASTVFAGNNSITITLSGQNIACAGDSTGAITLNSSSSTATYIWNTGVTTQNLAGLPAGTYTVTATDPSGCSTTASITLTQSSPLVVTTDVTNVTCNGLSNGSIILTATGGMTPYSYDWANTPGTLNMKDKMNIAAGVCTVTVTDGNGCSTTLTVTVTQPAPIVITLAVTNVSCNGGPNGCVVTTVTGGTPNYTYLWSNGPTTQSICNLGPGMHTVTITDANGCTVNQVATITQPPPINISLSPTNVTCFGLPNGSIALDVAGGVSPYSYNWSNLPGTSDPEDPTSLSAGTYTVTVTDGNGCTKTGSITVTQPPPIVINSAVTNVSCNGLSNGSINLTIAGGMGSYSYNWSHLSGISDPEDPGGLAAGTYTVTVTDLSGCSQSRVVAVTQPNPLAITLAVTNVSCNGGSNGCVVTTVTGGTPNYTYLWSNGATTQSICNLGAGTHTVTVTDANGCIETRVATITQPPPINISFTATAISCSGLSDGTISLDVAGGTLPYSYNWSHLPGTSDLEDPTGLSADVIYTVTVTDAGGCTSTKSITIVQPLPFVITPTVTAVTCNGLSDGSITLSVMDGGTPPYSFDWSHLPGAPDPKDISGLAAGTYTVTVSASNGCTKIESITVPSSPISITRTTNHVSCNGLSDGSIALTAAGGAAPYVYDWSHLPGTSDPEDPTGLVAGIYTVTVTDANGCSGTDSGAVLQPDALVVLFVVDNVSCNGASDGSISLVVIGGTTPYSYNWAHLPGSSDPKEISGLSSTIYTVTVTDNNACTKAVSILPTEPAPLLLTFPQDTACLSTIVTYPIPVSLSNVIWTFPMDAAALLAQGPSSISLFWMKKGSFEIGVTGLDSNGCKLQLSLPLIVDGCLGTNDLILSDISVQPNPFTSQLRISSEVPEQDVLIQLTDIQGRIVQQAKANLGQHNIETEALPVGVYLLHIVRNGQRGTWKLVKM